METFKSGDAVYHKDADGDFVYIGRFIRYNSEKQPVVSIFLSDVSTYVESEVLTPIFTEAQVDASD
jgi:hypothetical protein